MVFLPQRIHDSERMWPPAVWTPLWLPVAVLGADLGWGGGLTVLTGGPGPPTSLTRSFWLSDLLELRQGLGLENVSCLVSNERKSETAYSKASQGLDLL